MKPPLDPMDTACHKRFFDDDRLNTMAWAWREATLSDSRITGFWFESDVRQDLLTPKQYYAFHVSVRDEGIDEFVAGRGEFVKRAGELKKEDVQDLVWPYARSYSGNKVSEDERRVTACWLTFEDARRVDLIVERHSKIRNIPRAFCRPLMDKEVTFESLVRHRIGKGNRVIQHRPTRPGDK